MDPEVEVDADDVAGVGPGIGLVVDRVVLTVVELTGAGVEGPEVTVLSVWSVELAEAEMVVAPTVVVLEAIKWVVLVGALEVGQLMGVQHRILIW